MSDNDHASFWWYIRWDKHCFIFVQPRSAPWSPCETPKLHHWTATGCDSPWSKRFLVTPSHQWCPLKIGDTPNHEKLEEFSPMFWWNMVKPPKISQVFFAATFPHLFGENLCHGARTSQEHHPGKAPLEQLETQRWTSWGEHFPWLIMMFPWILTWIDL